MTASIPGWMALAVFFAGVTPINALNGPSDGSETKPVFELAEPKGAVAYSGPDTIQALNNSIPNEYLLGPGDIVDIQVLDQPYLSGRRTIGPDGVLALPLIGSITLESLTRDQAVARLREAWSRYYKDPVITLQIEEFHNNRVFVLGRVEQPGVVELIGRGTLLEALSLAGSIPARERESSFSKCAVIRGTDQVIWIDLDELLVRGNLSLNIRLANKDVIYIPSELDAMVYVMGEVESPGVYRLTPKMSFLEALMSAGGPSEDGKKRHMALIRNIEGQPHVMKIRQRDFREGDLAKNVLLQENDIIYVSRKNIAKFNYFLRQINPFASLLLVREAVTSE